MNVINVDINMEPALTLDVNQFGYIVENECIIGSFLVEYYFEDHRQQHSLYYPRKS